jgi:hypothetical protein
MYFSRLTAKNAKNGFGSADILLEAVRVYVCIFVKIIRLHNEAKAKAEFLGLRNLSF